MKYHFFFVSIFEKAKWRREERRRGEKSEKSEKKKKGEVTQARNSPVCWLASGVKP